MLRYREKKIRISHGSYPAGHGACYIIIPIRVIYTYSSVRTINYIKRCAPRAEGVVNTADFGVRNGTPTTGFEEVYAI